MNEQDSEDNFMAGNRERVENEREMNKKKGERETDFLLLWLLTARYCTEHAPMGKTPRATTKDTRGAGSM